MYQATRIQLVLQGSSEPGVDYAERLEKLINDIILTKSNLSKAPIVYPTAAADGRLQTMIQWFEYENYITTETTK